MRALAAALALLAATAAQAQTPAPGPAPAPTSRQAWLAHGQAVYDYWCATCHGPGIGNNGVQFLPGTNALRAKYKGEKPALLTERTDLPADLTRFFVRNGVSIMPFFRKTEIGDRDLDALADYLARNTR